MATTSSVIPSVLVTRYVNALLAAAEKQGGFASLRADITTFLDLVRVSADLRRLLESPLVSAQAGAAAVRAVMESAGIGVLLTGFCAQAMRNRRGAMMADMMALALAEMDKRDGITHADVRVAAPLTPTQTNNLSNELSTRAGGPVDMRVTVDPALVGGMIVRMGSVQVDDSVAGKLERLKQSLRVASTAA